MPYQHILAAVDTNENPKPILEKAFQFAEGKPETVECVSVVPVVTSAVPYATSFQDSLEETTRQALSELAKEHVGLKCTLLMGKPSMEVTRHAKSTNAGLVVIGSHGKHGVELILGSTANGVVKHAEADVMAVRVDESGNALNKGAYKKILLATDLQTELPCIQAQKLAKRLNAELELVYAIPDATAMDAMFLPNIDDEIVAQAKARFLQFAQQHGVQETHCHMEQGNASSAIVACADRVGADLVIMGSHSRGALNALLIGSTSNSVLHHAKQDILLINLRAL